MLHAYRRYDSAGHVREQSVHTRLVEAVHLVEAYVTLLVHVTHVSHTRLVVDVHSVDAYCTPVVHCVLHVLHTRSVVPVHWVVSYVSERHMPRHGVHTRLDVSVHGVEA
jgi:hypothetical protein